MKKTILSLLFSLLTAEVISQTQSQYQGNWLGYLNVPGSKLRIGLSVSDSAGILNSFLMSPDQGVMRIEVEKTTVSNDTLFVKCKEINASFKGKLNPGTDTLTGIWIQGRKFPIKLSRVEKLPVMNRPQTPRKPYPYTEEEVSFTDFKSGITFSGTLTLPQGQEKFPAVVLVSGSGPQNRDEELLGHKPFLVIADYLTRKGFAVLRYDDRGTGKSKGEFSTATTEDFAKDAEAAFSFLLTHTRIDAAKTGIIGHSEGGMIAPMIASRNKKVAFIVLLAGPGLKGEEILLLQSELIQKADSTPLSEIETNNALNKKMYEIAMKEKDDKKASNKMRVLIDDYWKTLDAETISRNNLEKKQLLQSVYQILTPWFRYFLKCNPSRYLIKVKCPVLAVNGNKDLQVPALQNLEAINKYLTKAGNKNVTTHEFEGLNHLFQHAKTGSPAEYIDIEETFAPEALDYICIWIKEKALK